MEDTPFRLATRDRLGGSTPWYRWVHRGYTARLCAVRTGPSTRNATSCWPLSVLRQVCFVIGLLILAGLGSHALADSLTYGWQKVDDLNIFFREGGARSAPTLVFLHGNPASSIQYEKVMERLASASLHVIAMDYPSFGYSDAPDRKLYKYTFDHLAETVGKFLAARGITRYGLYMQDYGVPVGFRLISAAPDAISSIIVQNGVIHLDGFSAAQDPNGELRRHWQNRNPAVDKRRMDYLNALSFPTAANWEEGEAMSPDAILLMTVSEQRPGVIVSRNDLWFDYGTNVAHYLEWQKLLRTMKAPVLIIWGSRDDFFTTPGAVAYLRDAPRAEIHILDTVHFATLEASDEIAQLIVLFRSRHQF
jgi:pimeloyl-ACP methyl ester carboxylesterase